MRRYPNVTIKIIFKYKDKILMQKHPNGIFEFPGGRMEWKESILGALERELKEELKYSLNEEPELFDLWNYISKNGKRHSVMIYFIQQLDRKPKISPVKELQLLWLSRKEMNSIIKDQKLLDKIFRWQKNKHS